MLLIWMSIAGSIPLIIFLITWIIQKNSFNYTLGKSLLFISMIFYLVPVQLLPRLLPDEVYHCTVIGEIKSLNNVQVHFEYSDSTYAAIDDGIMWIPNIVLCILAIWFVIVLFFAVYEVIRYRKLMKCLLKDSAETIYYVEHFGYVNILVNNRIQTPYTIGFFHSRIIFPEILLESEYVEYIYRHESAHAKNYDALVKLICLIVICLHWFNPVAILLLFSYGNLCEYISDSYAVKDLTFEERKAYANLLLTDHAPKTMPVVWRSNFFGTKLMIKRRITYVMKNRMNKIQKLVAIVVSAVSLTLSTATVFAYEPLQSSTEEVVAELEEGDFLYMGLDENLSINEIVLGDIDFSGHEDVFITDDGEYIIPNNDSLSYAICNHTFGSGKVAKHLSNGNGGCTVKLYDAQVCTKCNYVVLGSLISTHIYVTCPH